MLRAEVGHSVLVSAGVDNIPALHQILNRTQDMLHDSYDWPYLEFSPYKNLAAGQRHYDLPTGLNMEAIECVVVWDNGTPQEIERGIGPAEYSQYDSDDDERASPCLKWDIKNPDGDGEQIEVWPIPDNNDQRLQFFGKRVCPRMVSNSDVCLHDDLAIVLSAAAEILARQESADAAAKKAMADQRIMDLRARTKGATSPPIMGGGRKRERLRGQTIINISG
jgi:hypothetical protein